MIDCAPDCDERDECTEAGEPGHWYCGHCADCDVPRHHCGHGVTPEAEPLDFLRMSADEVGAALADFLQGR